MTPTESAPWSSSLERQMVRLQKRAELLTAEIGRAGSPGKAAQLQRRAAHRRLWADRIRDHLLQEVPLGH